MSRRLTVLAVVVIACVLGLLAGSRDGGRLARVHSGELVLGVEVTGTLQAVDSVMLGPPQVTNLWNFKISMLADEGTEVEVGDPVVAFDSDPLQQRLRRHLNSLESAKKKFEKEEIDLAVAAAQDRLRRAEAEAGLRRARLKAARPPELVADIEYSKARLDLEVAERELGILDREIAAGRRASEAKIEALRSDIDRAQSRVLEIQTAIKKMTVIAPRSGIVVLAAGRRFEKLKVGDSCWWGRSVAEIPSLDIMKAEGEVREVEFGVVSAGDEVRLRLDAHPDIEFMGTVVEIEDVVRQRSRRNPEKVVGVSIALDTTDPERMRPGMRFKGQILTERVEEVVLVPLGAIRQTEDGPTVDRATPFGSRVTSVSLGRHSQDEAEVLSGLDAGDRVYLHDHQSAEP